MKYCKRCIIPSTRPNISFNGEGLCSACQAFEYKKKINWEAREKSFRKLVDAIKSPQKGYDCLIPVSGGKDSTWQVVKCLEYGLKPLTVTWKTPARLEIGASNLKALVELGVDHIDYQVSPKVEKKFMLEALERYGATAIPMHMAIFNIPINIAVKFNIRTVVWGENSALEYGSSGDDWMGSVMDEAWFARYGVTHGTKAGDWISDNLTEKELTPYFGPGDDEIAGKNIRAIFLGYYFSWDPRESYSVAREHGFRTNADGPRTGYYEFADIDDEFISIHHYLKWYKFGFTRLFDNLSLEIRNGRIGREEAISILREQGEQRPVSDISKFCEFVGITEKRFDEIIEKFRNEDIWVRENGIFKIRDFLIPDWRWT